jgi:hypothetical protein
MIPVVLALLGCRLPPLGNLHPYRLLSKSSMFNTDLDRSKSTTFSSMSGAISATDLSVI